MIQRLLKYSTSTHDSKHEVINTHTKEEKHTQ